MTDEQIRGLRLWYDLCKDNKELVEIRAIDPINNKVYSGYFKDIDTIIEALKGYEHCNIYWTLNDIDESCYSRLQKNKLLYKTKESTSDRDIIGYRFILCDIDCQRPSGVASSDEELEYAKKKANDVYSFLRNESFSEPIVICSGSGVHLLYRVSLKNTPERQKLVKDFLDTLGMLFSDERVHIDGVVGNLSRISRLPYFMNRKGSNTKERPHRMAYIVKAPPKLKPTDPEYIERITALLPQPEQPSRANHYQNASAFDLEAFIQKYNIKIAKRIKTPQCEKLVLEECPFNHNHKAPDSAIFVFPNNAIAFRCLHASDSHFTWKDVRLHFDPHSYDRQTYSEFIYKRNYYGMRPPFVPEPVTKEQGEPWLKMSEIKKTELSADDYIPTGIKTLDDVIIGQHLGQVSVWSGRRGCAKSTLINQVLLGAANRGARCALITRELSKGETKQWMMLQLAGKQFNQKSKFNDFYFTPQNVVERIDPWIDEYLRIYNNAYKGDILNLEDKIRDLYAKWPFQILTIDNLMSIEIDDLGESSEWNNQKKLLNMLTSLARELNIHIHLVAHPNKNRQWIDCDSISGSGNIANYAQNVFLVSRIYPDTFEIQAKDAMAKEKIQDILSSGCTNIVQIAKYRDKGTAMGKIIKLWFETESNRLKSDPYEVINYNWMEMPSQQTIDMPSYEVGQADSDSYHPFSDPDFLTQISDDDIPF